MAEASTVRALGGHGGGGPLAGGGGAAVDPVLFVILGVVVSIVLGAYVLVRSIRLYRRGSDARVLLMGVGIFLLSAGRDLLALAPTAGGLPSPLGELLSVGVKLLGLGAVLAAIYDASNWQRLGAVATVAAPLGVLAALSRSPPAMQAVTAVVGGWVGYEAYRGYRRNHSRVMLLLAAGIVLLTAPAFALGQPLDALGAGDATILLVLQVARLGGLGAILHTFVGR